LEVLIQHNGYVTVYSHLASVAPSLGTGIVSAGEEVGIVGRTGVSFGPHLFFALLKQGQAVDPSTFLGVPACAGASRQDLEMLTQRAKLTTRHYYLNDDSGLHEAQVGSPATDRISTVADIYPPQVNLLLTRAPALR
jgi:murein DD-endopeptidase MepM/ murein hydrolase activator NlpD